VKIINETFDENVVGDLIIRRKTNPKGSNSFPPRSLYYSHLFF
jgi:hypothetical protein